ncbi:MAG TPA: M50 family metallopeptidase [Candidatus Baltobacteraceae bacterium]|nr:M50 family metallopeptidase [Candidatus Baltobacteraceae bacterium]
MLLLATISIASILKVVLFVAVLSVLIVLHEYGHFIFARLNRVRVMEFAVGMGPLIAGWTSKRSGTQYSLRAFPIGGYCAMHGEDNKVSEADQQRDFRETVTVNGREYDTDNFQAKSAGRRLAIIVAGPIANFLVALAILFAGAVLFGVPGDSSQQRVGQMIDGLPAAKAGMHPGDLIVAINGSPLTSGDKLIDLIHGSLGKPLNITYARGDAQKTVRITPVQCPNTTKPQGCIGFAPVPVYRRGTFAEDLTATGYGFTGIAEQTFGSLALLASHFRQYAGQLNGVVGMGQAAVTIQDFGWGPYFQFAALISFALGVFNLLPLPALDGGRAAFIIGEVIRGKPVDPEKEAWVHITGFAVLIALMVVINLNNIIKIVEGKGPF